jgi:penicillin-binding protein 1A
MLKAAAAVVLTFAMLAVAGASGVLAVFWYYGRGLPDYQQLADYQPPVVTRIHAGDGRLLAEFAREKRIFVPIEAMPKRIVKAFLSAEDKNFYSHPGVDFTGVIRAVITNINRLGSHARPVGASTITQQVAKNFLLTNEVSIERKIKEAILAFRIEHALSKDRILELYLNEIYLGYGSYGVAAAALNYFNKSLDELSIGEAAFIAGLPKAPNNYNPTRSPTAARARRDYVIGRMAEDGYVTTAQAAEAVARPLVVRPRIEAQIARADYFVEEVRRELQERYGEKGLYGGGLSVRTTLDTRLQAIADAALRGGMIAYDRRHGWRGPLGRVTGARPWRNELRDVGWPPGIDETMPAWRTAVVLQIADDRAVIGLDDGAPGHIPLSELKWAREDLRKEQRLGPPVRHPSQVFRVGDVVLVEPLTAGSDGKAPPPGAFALRQVPEIGGAVVALDPHTGRVLAMSGGFSYANSQFNRATQARRQPGSAFKPFVYLAALDKGFTPSSLVLDAPFVIDQGPGLGRWKPANYEHRFYGPVPMRLGIEKSRNLMTVRLAQNIGMEAVADYAERFGIVKKLPHMLSMALGAADVTLLDLTQAYAMLANGGKRIRATLIDRIQDRHGRTIFRHERRPCEGCRDVGWRDQDVPSIPDTRQTVADPRSAYQIVSMLQGVVERGTGRRLRAIGKPLAGKTGTTNDSRDAWFMGFSPDLVVGVFMGFDQPRTLGRGETGSSVAVPVFKQIMEKALEGKPPVPFRIPSGIRLVRVDADTGLPASPGDRHVILEAFKPGTEPTRERQVLDGSGIGTAGAQPTDSIGGLY